MGFGEECHDNTLITWSHIVNLSSEAKVLGTKENIGARFGNYHLELKELFPR